MANEGDQVEFKPIRYVQYAPHWELRRRVWWATTASLLVLVVLEACFKGHVYSTILLAAAIGSALRGCGRRSQLTYIDESGIQVRIPGKRTKRLDWHSFGYVVELSGHSLLVYSSDEKPFVILRVHSSVGHADITARAFEIAKNLLACRTRCNRKKYNPIWLGLGDSLNSSWMIIWVLPQITINWGAHDQKSLVMAWCFSILGIGMLATALCSSVVTKPYDEAIRDLEAARSKPNFPTNGHPRHALLLPGTRWRYAETGTAMKGLANLLAMCWGAVIVAAFIAGLIIATINFSAPSSGAAFISQHWPWLGLPPLAALCVSFHYVTFRRAYVLRNAMFSIEGDELVVIDKSGPRRYPLSRRKVRKLLKDAQSPGAKLFVFGKGFHKAVVDTRYWVLVTDEAQSSS